MNLNPYYWRIEVYEETQSLAKDYFPDQATTIVYDEDDLFVANPNDQSAIEVEVVNKDTIDVYISLQDSNFNPVLLNMADPSIPGGCVHMGASSQEENIFRRSNYFMTLKFQEYYPLLNLKTLYSKDVVLFRENEESNYRIMNSPRKLAIIAAASIKHPCLDQQGRIKDDQIKHLQFQKICMIFSIAIKQKHDSIVLSAFGCGAFKCPAKEIAELFKEAIKIYGKYFKKIIFAIQQPIDDPRKNNYEIFKETLK